MVGERVKEKKKKDKKEKIKIAGQFFYLRSISEAKKKNRLGFPVLERSVQNLGMKKTIRCPYVVDTYVVDTYVVNTLINNYLNSQ